MTDPTHPFLSAEDAALSADFIRDGYIIRQVEDTNAIDRIRGFVAGQAAAHLGIGAGDDLSAFLNGIHKSVEVSTLNDLRLAVFNAMRTEDWFKPAYYTLARNAINGIVGNELAMQRSVNLSIQLPDDDSSLLPMHADVLNGDSCFEVVLWVPMVDCEKTKSMYLLSPERTNAIFKDFANYDGRTSEDIFKEIEHDVEWLEVPYGSYLLFSQNLLHGNVVNREPDTRWSMNCRFKSLLSPYADKKFGEFFEPITMRAATRVGLDFKEPKLGQD